MRTKEGRDARRTAAAVLTAKDVLRLRRMAAQGQIGRDAISYRELSRAYGVSVDALRRAIRGDTWAWIQPVSVPEGFEGLPGEIPPEREQALKSEAAKSQERFLNNLAAEGLLPKEKPE